MRRLRHEPGVRLALVQSDVYQAFVDQDASGNPEAGALTRRPLRVVMPLYDEEIYFIVRADSPPESIDQIRDARINVGPLLSGTAMTATTLYRQMFGRVLPDAQASYLGNEEALVKLTGARSVDVVVVVAEQPARLLADMTPQARDFVKLLGFDAAPPAGQAALRNDFPASVRARARAVPLNRSCSLSLSLSLSYSWVSVGVKAAPGHHPGPDPDPPSRSRKLRLRILPTGLSGNSLTISSRSGSLKAAMSCARRNAISSSKVSV